MAFPVPAGGDGGHGNLHHHTPFPAFSSNRPFKKHIAPLEILSEATEDTDAGFVIEDTEDSLCTSPTCTKESSSDEGAKLLVQPFGSSEQPPFFGDGAKASANKVGASNVQQISQSSAFKAAAEKTRSKVSFHAEKAESSATKTQMHRQMLEFLSAEASASSARGNVGANRGKPRADTDVRPSPQCISPHAGALSSDRCFSLKASGATHLLRSHCSHALLKLRGFIRQQQEGDASEDDDGSVQGQCPLPDTSMDDVNEMKALLNTINRNLKMLETRGKAHPQLLSSRLAPVYFTT
ncbi:hypothetical protein GOP47_0027686 [Adiantum capillus-veneris]|nr:hypothetical protein GOP47_0027686 [Adiantum capillus-veneris]